MIVSLRLPLPEQCLLDDLSFAIHELLKLLSSCTSLIDIFFRQVLKHPFEEISKCNEAGKVFDRALRL